MSILNLSLVFPDGSPDGIGYKLGVLARSADIASKVRSRVATVAVLSLQCSSGPVALFWVADQHAETLHKTLGPQNILYQLSRSSAYWLESGNLAGLGRDIVHEDTAADLVTKVVAKL